MIGNLKPATIYWYRFIDMEGNASRTGRTRTAPRDEDARPVRFTFVSCQSINTGASNALRRMIFDDESAAPGEQLDFLLHLGDFVYETVWYPEDNPQGVAGRKLFDRVRYPHGERRDLGLFGIVHTPSSLEDYRTLYRAHLNDPDLQDARARWPFICVWDNEEFSDSNWQSMRVVANKSIASQRRKVIANQAWFEYQPARVSRANENFEHFVAPQVNDVLPTRFDSDGLGLESNNLTAIGSLTVYRALRFGANVELLLTDLFSYRSEPLLHDAAFKTLQDSPFDGMCPEEALAILDAGRAYAGGRPPDEFRCGDHVIANSRKDHPPQTLLGATQRDWFLQRLESSQATWKIWAQTQGNLYPRLDLDNLPPGMVNPWPGVSYAGEGDAIWERQQICDRVREAGVTGFVTVSGNRHSFWAGFASSALPPQAFEPVGVTFITAAISSPSPFEYYSHMKEADRPLGSLMVTERPGKGAEPTLHLLYRHGFKAAAEYARSGDIAAAASLSNPQVAPHIRFCDATAHGYARITATSKRLECEFVCIKVPRERTSTPDGGALVYRIVHRTPIWKAGGTPSLEQEVLYGKPVLSV